MIFLFSLGGTYFENLGATTFTLHVVINWLIASGRRVGENRCSFYVRRF